MKYSFIMPYFKRSQQLHKTLETFVLLYSGRKDFEIIIVEDPKNAGTTDHQELFYVMKFYDPVLHIQHIQLECAYPVYSPVLHYNVGVTATCGKYIILTSPEVKHETNILSGFDSEFTQNENAYVVCACEARDAQGKFKMWYQHTKHRDVRYHFCNAISKENYNKIGGFDREFAEGYCFDDDAFKARIELSGLPFVVRDDLKTVHQWHDKVIPAKHLWLRNEQLFKDNYGKGVKR